jgi:Na+/proline symporter
LFASWAVILFNFTLFLLIGTLLYVYYGDIYPFPPERLAEFHPELAGDKLYPAFIWHNLPTGVAGLLIAAILAAAMANVSAALNSLASTTVVDFFRARKKETTENESLRVARMATVVWGGVLLTIAIVARHSKSVLEAGLSIGSIPAGALLGIFLLGVLTKKPGERSAMAGVVAGLGVILYVVLKTKIAFTWYVMIGTTVTFAVALLASMFETREKRSV